MLGRWLLLRGDPPGPWWQCSVGQAQAKWQQVTGRVPWKHNCSRRVPSTGLGEASRWLRDGAPRRRRPKPERLCPDPWHHSAAAAAAPPVPAGLQPLPPQGRQSSAPQARGSLLSLPPLPPAPWPPGPCYLALQPGASRGSLCFLSAVPCIPRSCCSSHRPGLCLRAGGFPSFSAAPDCSHALALPCPGPPAGAAGTDDRPQPWHQGNTGGGRGSDSPLPFRSRPGCSFLLQVFPRRGLRSECTRLLFL